MYSPNYHGGLISTTEEKHSFLAEEKREKIKAKINTRLIIEGIKANNDVNAGTELTNTGGVGDSTGI